jgi:RIO-like serine/threonine protein kinase
MKTLVLEPSKKPYKSGSGSHVYRLGEVVVKVPYHIMAGSIEREYRIQQKIFKSGIKVPEPYCLVKVIRRNQVLGTGMVMQYLSGIRADEIKSDLMRMQVDEVYKEEIARCRDAGFSPRDHGLHNVIFNKKVNLRNGVFLIDFEEWKL